MSRLARTCGRTALVAVFFLALAFLESELEVADKAAIPASRKLLGVPYFIFLYNLLWIVFFIPLDRYCASLLSKRPILRLIGHAVAAPLVPLIHLGLFYLVLRAFAGFSIYLYWPQGIALRSLVVDFAIFNGLLYIALAAYSTLFELTRRSRESSIRAAHLEAELMRAQLQSLRIQLRPHFLFNTLNTISGYVDEDPAKAVEMIALLSDLLRASLNDEGAAEVSLEQELDLTQRYLAIERLRFIDRLTVRYDIDPAVKGLLVPSMLLQPLVENAVRHGVARSPQAGIIAIGARRLDGGLEISVSDNGQGLAAETARNPTGIGLRNTRERLEKLYGDRHQFMVANRDPAGVEVRIRLPCYRSLSRAVEARKPT